MQRCYILGAGFSKSCCLPLASELTAQVFAHARDELKDLLPERGEQWLGIMQQLYPSCDFRTYWPDFEELITSLDEVEQYRADYQGTPTPAGPLQAAHLKKVLLRHLAYLLCERLDGCPAECLEPVERFAQAVHRFGDRIVCFNWDLVLETVCKRLGLKISYGGKVSGDIELAKPHGSLNLAQDSRLHYEETRERSGKHSNVRDLDEEWQIGDKVILRVKDPKDARERIIDPFKDKVLVEPNARKTYASGWLRMQWARALRMVRAADEIVIIGYSLPKADFRPRLLIQMAALERATPPNFVLVDPKLELILQRYRELLSAPINLAWKPWVEWAETDERLQGPLPP
jgi:hypothetical protein